MTSDKVGYFSLITGLASIVSPGLWYQEFGPIKPMFEGSLTPESSALISFTGTLLLFIGVVSYGVRWNTINSITATLGYSIAAVNSLYIAYQMDGSSFVLRGWHVIAVMYVLGALHMKFNPNPVWTSKTLKAHEDEKAKKEIGVSCGSKFWRRIYVYTST